MLARLALGLATLTTILLKKDQDLVQVGESKSRNAGKKDQDLVQVGESESRSESRDEKKCKSGNEKVK